MKDICVKLKRTQIQILFLKYAHLLAQQNLQIMEKVELYFIFCYQKKIFSADIPFSFSTGLFELKIFRENMSLVYTTQGRFNKTIVLSHVCTY